ncbi:hypothetical protein BpHYR1_053649 [Brachionus plicatilis]|uniref:Uncharacterized protein n=1 Tax=Brachionus plicatilis TaxID=10195 RepID=A0A3M7RST0_BRAPC|nr:hypothetical protein BpHYR1_053649 [Brachionus plicatilis]
MVDKDSAVILHEANFNSKSLKISFLLNTVAFFHTTISVPKLSFSSKNYMEYTEMSIKPNYYCIFALRNDVAFRISIQKFASYQFYDYNFSQKIYLINFMNKKKIFKNNSIILTKLNKNQIRIDSKKNKSQKIFCICMKIVKFYPLIPTKRLSEEKKIKERKITGAISELVKSQSLKEKI